MLTAVLAYVKSELKICQNINNKKLQINVVALLFVETTTNNSAITFKSLNKHFTIIFYYQTLFKWICLNECFIYALARLSSEILHIWNKVYYILVYMYVINISVRKINDESVYDDDDIFLYI